jgi:hypothetical protein
MEACPTPPQTKRKATKNSYDMPPPGNKDEGDSGDELLPVLK